MFMKKSGSFIQCFMFIALFSASIVNAEGSKDVKPLYYYFDSDLQSVLETNIRQERRINRLIEDKKLALCIVDLNGNTPRFARINGNNMMYAASLPKIAILLAAYESFEDGTLRESSYIKKDLIAMIRVSSNAAATRMIDRIGMKKINSVLENPKYELYDMERGGGLWVGKRYAKEGGRYPDPLNHISHGATATQVCRFYFLLANEKIISKQRSRQILQHLSEPGLHHKFVYALDQVAPDADVYRKSGSWREWHADSVLVRGTRWRNYILVALVQSSQGESIVRNLLPIVEKSIQQNTTTN